MKISVIRQTPKKENLTLIYDICNKIFKNDSCFYTKDEVQKLKTNNQNVFLWSPKKTSFFYI